MELLIIVGLVLLNGVFAMSEMSLVSSRKFKLESARSKGNKGAQTALELAENPTRFLSTVQIGITLIGVLLGIYSGENLTGDVEAFFNRFDLIRPFAHNLAVGSVVVFITWLSIVLGELFPKKLALTFPEPIAMLLSRPMHLLSKITAPFVWLLTITNNLLLHIFGIKPNLDSAVSEEEIKSIVRESAEGGEIDNIEHSIVERVFELGDRKVNALMTHHSDLAFFDENDGLSEIRQVISTEKHSAYPVCRDGDMDDIVGIVLLEDLFEPMFDPNFSLKNHLRKPVFVTESTLAYKLLEMFKQEKLHYAIVVNEFGSSIGVVTMDDVLDALVGDVSEHDQSEYQITKRDDGTWFVDGQYSVNEFLKYFDLQIDEQIAGNYLTVAGLFIHRFHGLPNVGDKVLMPEGYELEVVDKDGQRVDKILVKQMV
jgi:putative hemolysin